MPPTSRSAQAMVNQILTYVGIDSSTADADERSTALGWINDAYRTFLRGVYYDARGDQCFHNWSFMTETDDLSLTDGDSDVDCPALFGGILEDITFQYGDGDKGGLDIVQKSPAFIRQKQRDDNTEGTPQFWALNPKDFATADGSEYGLLFWPTPDEDLTVSITFRLDPADLTDSASVYPKGITGCEQVIVALAKADQEKTEGQVIGPEERKARRLMADLVRLDKEVNPTKHIQESWAEEDSGITA